MANLWRDRTTGWSEAARKLVEEGPLRDSTNTRYTTALRRLAVWCTTNGRAFPFNGTPDDVATTADYLEEITRGRARPESTLKIVRAAINGFAKAAGATSPTTDPRIDRLIDAIVARRTTRPLYSRAPLDPALVANYWRSKPANDNLSEEDLRAKALTIFALVKFLRPSDAARLNRAYMRWRNNDTECTFIEWGFKNDHALVGNAGFVPTHREKIVCPLSTLRDYRARTAAKEARIRDNLRRSYDEQWADTPAEERPLFEPFVPLFMALKDGRPISADTCAKIMKRIAVKAGADPQMFSAGSYHKGGADYALANGMSERDVQWIGKWKNKDVFERHYVSVRAPTDYAHRLFGIDTDTPAENTHDDDDTAESLFGISGEGDANPTDGVNDNWFEIEILEEGMAAESSPQLHTSSTSFLK